jgi:surface polysaccharide O-acyltransferase-like enzyme
VILLHVSAQNWSSTSVSSYEWQVFNFYDAISRFSVPVFVMLSGMFLLSPHYELTMTKLFKNKLLNIVVHFCFWSLFYALSWGIYKSIVGDSTPKTELILSVGKQLLIGHHHMWFLWMIGGLYVITPLVRLICEEKKYIEYYLWLWFIFGIVINSLQHSFGLNKLTVFTDMTSMFFVQGYVGYYIFGYYLTAYPLSKKITKAIYLLGIVGVLITILASSIVSIKLGEPNTFYGNLTPNVMFSSLAVVLFFKKVVSKKVFSSNQIRFISTLSRTSLGTYLLHPFLIDILARLAHIDTLSFNPFFSVPLLSFIVFVLCSLTIWLIDKIPVMRKYVI